MARSERIRLQGGTLDRALNCVLIAAGPTRTGLIFPPGVLFEGIAHFEGAPCFLDHAGAADLGRPGGRSVRDLVGVFVHIQWDDVRQAVTGHLLLAGREEWIANLAELFRDRPERFGLSADLTLKRRGETVSEIVAVHSVDIVMNPAAGGRIEPTSAGVGANAALAESVQGSDKNRQKGERKTMSEQIIEGNRREAVERVQGALKGFAQNIDSCVLGKEDGSPQNLGCVGSDAEGRDEVCVGERLDKLCAVEAASQTTAVSQTAASQTTAALAREVLAARIASARLPEPLAQLAHRTLADAGLDAALSQVDGLKRAWAAALEHSTIKGLGHVSQVRTGTERLELAFERLMGLDIGPQHHGIPRLTGIREMYDLLTGDWERHGAYRPDRVQFANATTSTMAEITRNVLNKVMLKAFEARPQWWKPIVYEDDFPNMQMVRWITVGGITDLDTVAEGGAYTEKSWDDYAETASFVKKGNYIGLTLEMIDRDDVGAVRALPRRLGYAANRTLSAAVAALFTDNSGAGPVLADGNNLFDAANHGNLLTTALSADAWDAVIQAMFKQTEYHSAKRLGIRPKFCLVPIELEKTALTIFTSDQEPGTPNNDANVRRYSAQVITVPEWTDAGSWAAAAAPADLEGVCIGYRFGRAPELYIAGDELMGSMFTNDEMRIKVRFVYAVGIGDYRALHKNNVA